MNPDVTTLRKEIEKEMQKHDESFDDCVSLETYGPPEAIDHEYYSIPSIPFTLWTHKRVYFLVASENDWVVTVSRNPDGKPERILVS
jgi:hypothetical protein